ncbi:MAG: MFS transporter [Provencibacterium sp.]|jgi:MFS family permease|nr:MFS transporter [Provencibacterium sp.]
MQKHRLWKRDFTIMVCGQVISLFGNAVLRFALSLYVLDSTGSAAAFGSILAVSLIPTLILSPVGGLLADRFNRQRIMVALDFVTALLLALFLLALCWNEGVAIVAVLMILLSVIQACYQPAVQASIPMLAEESDWPKANGIVIQVNAMAHLLGPILGGMLYGLLGFQTIVALSAGCFFLSAVMELFLHIPFTRPERTAGMFRTAAGDLLAAGRFLKTKPALVELLLVFAGLNLTLSAMLTIGLPFAVRISLGLGDRLYGFAQAAPAIGTILGGILAGSVCRSVRFRRSHLLLLASAAALLPMAITLTNVLEWRVSYLALLLSVAVCLCFTTIFNVVAQTYLQRQTPPQLLGRVASFVTVLCMCASPVGQAAYGLLFEKFRPSAAWIVLFTCAIGIALGLFTRHILQRVEE